MIPFLVSSLTMIICRYLDFIKSLLEGSSSFLFLQDFFKKKGLLSFYKHIFFCFLWEIFQGGGIVNRDFNSTLHQCSSNLQNQMDLSFEVQVQLCLLHSKMKQECNHNLPLQQGRYKVLELLLEK
jgi:hypothetical protein